MCRLDIEVWQNKLFFHLSRLWWLRMLPKKKGPPRELNAAAAACLRGTTPFTTTSATMSSTGDGIASSSDCVIEVRDHDVLFGRGKAVHMSPGNVCYRELVAERAHEYEANGCTDFRRSLALDIIGKVHSSNGRFLKKAYKPAASKESINTGDQVTAERAVWQTVELEVAVTKVKQALRDSAALKPSIMAPACADTGGTPAPHGPDASASSMSSAITDAHRQEEDIAPAVVANRINDLMLIQQQGHLQARRVQQAQQMWETEKQARDLAAVTILMANQHQPLPSTSTNLDTQRQLLLLTQAGLLAGLLAQQQLPFSIAHCTDTNSNETGRSRGTKRKSLGDHE